MGIKELIMKKMLEEFIPLKDGDRVKIDYDKLIKLPDYSNMQDQYKRFIEEHKGTVFTVKTYKRYAPDHAIVTFNENNEWDFAEVMLIRLDGDRYGTS